jgi:Na+/melibiose symporter-like transporter
MTASRSPFAIRDFRLLWLGESVSVLGDQFALIALPWLALVLTGSAFALGTVLAVMAVPRAVLMLVGGAYVDRLSPRRVMIVSNAVRFVAIGLLAAVVLAGQAQLWMLYGFALVFGMADAFFYPAHTAITPELVEGEQLQKANGVIQGTTQFAVLLGPALAGVAIAILGASGTATTSPSVTGVGVALALDAATFVASILTLMLIRPRNKAHVAEKSSVVKDIVQGVRFVWHAPALRVILLVSMGLNLLIVGPIDVGLPYLAYARLPEGAVAFGLIMSAFGGGSLIGLLAAMLLPRLRPAHFGTIVLLLVASSGLSVAGLAFTSSTPAVLVMGFITGSILGYTNVSMLTWAQRRIPRALMGRVMSLLVFASVALMPISIAVAGVFVEVSFEGLLLFAGLGMTVLTLTTLLSRSVRNMGLEPVVEEPAVSDVERTPQGDVAEVAQPLAAA